jgi:hypothetical protein
VCAPKRKKRKEKKKKMSLGSRVHPEVAEPVMVVEVCPKAAEEEGGKAATYFPVRVNEPAANARHPFPTNYTRTTKYTLLSFLPKNLFEQYRKATNVCRSN